MFGIIDSRSHSLPGKQRSGYGELSYKDSDRKEGCDTVQCCHCSYTWVYTPGSGRTRGICLRCNGITCGRDCCEKKGCVFKEAFLDLMEQGILWEDIHEGQRSVKVSVAWPGGMILG